MGLDLEETNDRSCSERADDDPSSLDCHRSTVIVRDEFFMPVIDECEVMREEHDVGPPHQSRIAALPGWINCKVVLALRNLILSRGTLEQRRLHRRRWLKGCTISYSYSVHPPYLTGGYL